VEPGPQTKFVVFFSVAIGTPALKEAAPLPLLLLVIAALTCDWNIWRWIDTLITLANAAYGLAMLIPWLIRNLAAWLIRRRATDPICPCR
jgi:hypothetical protein